MSKVICDGRVAVRVKGKVYSRGEASPSLWLGDRDTGLETANRAWDGKAEDVKIFFESDKGR